MKRRRGYTRLSSKNQITLPADVVSEAGLRPGDELKVARVNGKIVLEPALSLGERRLEAIRRTKGALTGVYPPDYLEKLRDEWR